MQDQHPLESPPATPSYTRRLLVHAVAAGFGSFIYAAVTAVLALGMTGAGHGWGSAAPSWLGIFVIPPAAVAAVYRHTWVGLGMCSLALIAGAVIDVMIIQSAQNEGMEYFHRVWKVIPGNVIGWVALWSLWQVALLGVLVAGVLRGWRNP